MLKEERQQKILTLLRDEGKIVATDLSRVLETSEDTIRRDLRELDEAGLLLRVHGGALPRTTTPLAYTARAGQGTVAKNAMALATVKRLRNGQVILLDGGTTALSVAQHLPPDLQVTVITQSVPAMAALTLHPTVEVVMLGGRMFKEAQVAIGAQTIATLRDIRADVCIMGAVGIHPDVGISTLDYEDGLVKQAIVRGSAEVIVLAAADKIGKSGPFLFASLDQVDVLVTERDVPEEVLAVYRAHGITVVTE